MAAVQPALLSQMNIAPPAQPRGTPATSMATSPTINFDLSPIQGLSPSQKYNNNLVSDITSAYQTYVTGAPVGRGGQYAVSAQQKYGYASIADAAAGYLQAAGIPILSTTAGATGGSGTTGVVNGSASTPVVTTPDTTGTSLGTGAADLNSIIGQQFQNLSDAFKTAFGTATYNPPLESQYYSGQPANIPISDPNQLGGYTSLPPGATAATGGGLGLGTILIIGALAIGGWYLWKHYHGA